MKDKTEFEIELFNPTQKHVLAKIKLNDTYISGGGVVLRPGERVFLERFLDSNNRFKFSTYIVEKGNSQVDSAIANNGAVQIEFYDEYVKPNYNQDFYYYQSLPIFNPINPIHHAYFSSGTISAGTNVSCANSLTTSNFSTTTNFTNSLNTAISRKIDSSRTLNKAELSSTKETGTVDKGSISEQRFTNSSREFNSFVSNIVSYQILPESEKIYAKEDLVVYCTECGSKKKKDNHKFCPHCGNKY